MLITPALQEALCTVHDHILYISEQTLDKVQHGGLPPDDARGYAMRCTVALNVHPNMRHFIAHQAALKVHEQVDATAIVR